MSAIACNDDRSTGGFGEMECMGQVVGAGRASCTNTLSLWCHAGALEDLKAIGHCLLGTEVSL